MRWFFCRVLFVGVAAALVVPGCAWSQANSATYVLAPAGTSVTPQPSVRITAGPTSAVGGEVYGWWELVYNAPGEATPRFTAQFLSDRIPMRIGGGKPTHIAHYLYAERNLPVVEYLDEESGEALLPEFDFLQHFIPTPSTPVQDVDGFIASGRYLGHALKLESTQQQAWTPLAATPLVMRRHLLVGCGRTHKDDGTPPDANWNYVIVPWTAQDYEDMIASGRNYFLFGAVPYTDYHDRAIFYTAPVQGAQWPQQFYRSSYLGPSRYLDEPSSRAYAPLSNMSSSMHFPEEMGAFTEVFVQAAVNHEKHLIRRQMASAGIDTGDMVIIDPSVECWETIYEAAFYHYAGGVGAFIHESRFVLDMFNDQIQNYFMVNETLTRDEMFEFHYAAMRGGARPFDRPWGMSVYGQMENVAYIPSVIKAYEMGAEHIWFWTGDGDHHVPFADQLAITQALTDHAAAQPRPRARLLRRQAESAVLLPYGYVLGGGHPLSWSPDHFTCLWGQKRIPLDSLNRSGATHRSILTLAVSAAIAEMRAGRSFDVAIDAPEFDPSGYTRIIRVNANGTTTVLP